MWTSIAKSVLPRSTADWLRLLRRRLRARRGLPPSLDFGRLDGICRAELGAALVAVRHLPLSGWKRDSGAYRLLMRTADGRAHSLVYKDANYSAETIPALVGLPVRPGPPEFVVYGVHNRSLSRLLPHVYWREQGGHSFRFLLQDLGSHYLPMSYLAERDRHTLRLAASLPDIQRNLEESLTPGQRRGLLRLDRAYSRRLVAYAHASLREYLQHRSAPAVEALLRSWPEVAQSYLDPSHFEARPVACVHGDLNPSNVHVESECSADVKLVDWEWAAVGLPHLDLASLLLGRPAAVRARGVAAYAARDRRSSPREHWRFYRWAEMDRSLVTAAYVGKQDVGTAGRVSWLPRLVDECAERLLAHGRRGLDAGGET